MFHSATTRASSNQLDVTDENNFWYYKPSNDSTTIIDYDQKVSTSASFAIVDSSTTSIVNYSNPFLLVNSSSCFHYVTTLPDYASSDLSKYLFAVFYSTIFVLGMLGNITMLYVTLSKRTMITVQNIFLMNLAVGDIVVCLLSVPITPIVLIYKEWYFGLPLCHLIMWVQGSSIFISTLTLTAIALDRYMLIVYPYKQPITIKTSLWIIAGIWTLSGVVTLPYAYFMRVVRYEGICGEFCDEAWPSDGLRRAFTTLVFVCQFVVPFSIMSYCYATILHRLKRRIKYKLDRMNFRQTEKMALTKRKRRSTIVLACMVLIFGLTWLPQNAISMISNYVHRAIPEEYVYFAYLAAHCFAMLSILANPVLYAWLNSAFRKIIIRSCANWRVTIFLRRRASATLTASTRTTGFNPELCTDYLMRNYDSCRRKSTKHNFDNFVDYHLTPIAAKGDGNCNVGAVDGLLPLPSQAAALTVARSNTPTPTSPNDWTPLLDHSTTNNGDNKTLKRCH